MDKIKAGVVGAGYLGQFHAEKYAHMEGVDLVGVVDIDPHRAKKIAKKCRTRPFFHHADLLDHVQAVSIAVPTPLHHLIAKDFLSHGHDVLVEKPICQTGEEAHELVALAESRNLILQVGHVERFNGPMLALEGRVQHPKFIEANRLGPFLFRGTDVDVVLDLMIHDIDIILSWVDSNVKWLHAVGIPVLTPHIDIANVRIEFENGCTASLTASRISRERIRKIRLFQPAGYLSIDFLSSKITSAERQGDLQEGTLPKITIRKIPVKKTDPLRNEIESFIQCVRHREVPRVSGREGRRALEVALTITHQIRERIEHQLRGI